MKNRSKIQNPKSKIAIVGAGPAGASLAIRLAQKGFGVMLIERERYPRHKLCGEFISPECLEHFRELGVLAEMTSQGGDRITETVFYSEDGQSVGVPSEWFGGDAKGALGLSRAEMDFRLLERARESGVEVFEETQVVGILDKASPGRRNRASKPDRRVGGVKVRDKKGELREISSDLTIDATGRARVLGKLVEREISRNQSKIQNPKSKIPWLVSKPI